MMEMSPTKIVGGDGILSGGDGGVRTLADVGSLLVEASNAYNLALLLGGSLCAHASCNSERKEVVSINNVIIYFYNYKKNSKSHPFPLPLEAIVVFV